MRGNGVLQHLRVFFHGVRRRNELYPSEELEYPCVEGRAEADLGGEEECRIVDALCLRVLAEMIQHGVHGGFVAQKLDPCALRVIKIEGLLRELGNAVLLRLRHGGLVQNSGRFQNAVHAEGCDLAVFIRPTHHIIAVAVPSERIRAENVGHAAVFQLAPLCRRELKIEEGYLPLFIYGFVYRVDKIIDVLVVRLYPFGNGDIPFKARRGVLIGKLKEFARKHLALFSVMNFDDSTASIKSFSSGSSKRRSDMKYLF